jgi:hypothetical protein
MASFMTRVELHGANPQDYETLHAAMEHEGFSRFIAGSDGRWYQLPTAEYNRIASVPRDQVLESAKRAAATTKKAHGIFVTEAVTSTWCGLPAVQNPQ